MIFSLNKAKLSYTDDDAAMYFANKDDGIILKQLNADLQAGFPIIIDCQFKEIENSFIWESGQNKQNSESNISSISLYQRYNLQ